MRDRNYVYVLSREQLCVGLYSMTGIQMKRVVTIYEPIRVIYNILPFLQM
jgi:hypothetical protein